METTAQLTAALTAHIALYRSSLPAASNPNPNPRSAILRHLSSLPSLPHRQSLLTSFSPALLSLLLLMLHRLRRLRPPLLFFLLPDLPAPLLPSLLHRRAPRPGGGLGGGGALLDSVLLFGSGAEVDSFTLSEDILSDMDNFVSIMDGITNGQFLRGDVGVGELTAPWVELPWLKEKGYYSMEEFVANRVEVALRLSWMGVKGKGREVGRAREVAGLAAGAFWRVKGCVDWWKGLEEVRRKKVFTVFFGKAAKSLASEIAKGPSTDLKNEICFFDVEAEKPLRYGPIASWKRANQQVSKGPLDFGLDMVPVPPSGKPDFLANLFSRLLVVREISSMQLSFQLYENQKERFFFSRLESALSVSDCILRKLRGLLMVVSTDYINLELMGDSKSKTVNKEKKKTGCRKGKNKSNNLKKLNAVTIEPNANSTLPKPSVDHGCAGDLRKDTGANLSSQKDNHYATSNQKTRAADTCCLQKDLEYANLEVKHDMGTGSSLTDCKGHAEKKKSGKKGAKARNDSSKKLGNPDLKKKEGAFLPVSEECGLVKSVGLTDPLTVNSTPNGTNSTQILSFCNASEGPGFVDGIELTKSPQVFDSVSYSSDRRECIPYSGQSEDGQRFKHVSLSPTQDEKIPRTKSVTGIVDICDKLMGHCNESSTRCSTSMSTYEATNPTFPTCEAKKTLMSSELGNQTSRGTSEGSTLRVAHSKWFLAPMAANVPNQTTSMGLTSYEWPSVAPLNFISASSQHCPATADRLHLDVGYKGPSHFRQPFLSSRPQMRNSSLEGAQSHLTSPALPLSFDWPPMVKSCSRLSQTVNLRYDSGCAHGLQSPFCSGFAAHGLQTNGTANENEINHYGDIIDVYDMKTAPELADDVESYWWSEEESDAHAFSERDYNQFFGGGVMYWNPGEHVGTGFSRPPSHSSEDSSWAWREADLNRAIDDMVGLSGMPASYSTNGLASPPAATFCSPFDPLGPGHQTVGYAMPGSDGSGKILHSSSSASDALEEKISRHTSSSPSAIEGVNGDQLPYQRLRPIIVPGMSRRGSRSEFKLGHDHKSSCVPSARSQPPRIKRPPSPVVLCVPPVPRPPPPSPVGISRRRGFPIVRSGSSSPRHWGIRSHEESNPDETCLYLDGAEVVWPSWGNKGFSAPPLMQPIQGSLLQDHLIKISQLARDQGHPDVALPVQPPESLDCSSRKTSLPIMHSLLHEEIETFCKQVAAKNLIKKPYINWAVRRVTRALQVLWPRSRINIFGSNATGLALPTSDVDLVVSLPPVRNLEPIKEAGILEGRNGIKETCLQHAARYLANQEWVRNDSLKTIENTAIPVIMLLVEVPHDLKLKSGSSPITDGPQSQSTKIVEEQVGLSYSGMMSADNTPLPMYSDIREDCVEDVKYLEAKSVRLDISFKSPSHTGLQTSELVRELTQQFPATVALALVLKKFLADRSLDHSYSGGLSSYCLMLLITRFLQHEHHIGRPINQNLGSLLMDFLYFFGNVFDPRQMRISIQGSGVYMKRERGLSIDPIHIDDPLYPTNNVGRNCFRIHQCIKAFADAYTVLESELPQFSCDGETTSNDSVRLLPKIIPSIDCEE